MFRIPRGFLLLSLAAMLLSGIVAANVPVHAPTPQGAPHAVCSAGDAARGMPEAIGKIDSNAPFTWERCPAGVHRMATFPSLDLPEPLRQVMIVFFLGGIAFSLRWL